MSPITLRAPSDAPSDSSVRSASLTPPKLSWLCGTWTVTHSTLPMWKKNRNVKITYMRIPNTSPPQLDDLVTYQPLNSSTMKTISGVDKPFAVPDTVRQEDEGREGEEEEKASLGYHWRGKGWLTIASSKWEILGYGDEEGGANQWVVTYFAKTLFTPEGLDIYARGVPLKASTVEEIKSALKGLGGRVAGLAEEVFVVAADADEMKG